MLTPFLKERLGLYLPVLAMVVISQYSISREGHQASAKEQDWQIRLSSLNLTLSSAAPLHVLTQDRSAEDLPSDSQTLAAVTAQPTASSKPSATLATTKPTTPSSTSSTPTPSTTTSTPAPTVNYLSAGGILDWTNKARSGNGLSSLTLNSKLNQAAKARVDDMFEKQYFAHTTPGGGSYVDAINAVGYSWKTVQENLASGDPSYVGDEKVVSLWMDSPGHRANILAPSITEMGIAIGEGIYQGKRSWIAVQLFGTP